ncbi:glycosyltransferase [Nonomuraea sp. NPDC049646]|uniref:glycosyltransferase n=1 Tax=unclassified Nonomuraea TaxID=2593643 RepID=UPI00378EAC89
MGTTSGGTGRHVRMLVEGLMQRGHQVAVVGPGSVEEAFSFRAAGAAFAEVPVSDRPHPLNDLRAVLAIRRLTRDADVVHAHGLRAGALASLALRAFRTQGTKDRVAPVEEAGRRDARGRGTSVQDVERRETRGGEASVQGVGRREAGGGGASVQGVGGQVAGGRGAPVPDVVGLEGAGREGSGQASGEREVRGQGGSGEGAGGRRGGGRLGKGPGVVVTLHNALTAGGFVGFVYGVLERIVARRADRVLVVSPDLAERMTVLGAREVAEAVVPAPPLRPARRRPEEVREELGAGDRPLVLTIGRLAQQKGLDTLLDVAAGPWESPAPLFAVAGEGPLRAELEDRIRSRSLSVLLLGDRDDVPDLLAAASVVVNCSRWEGLPLSLSEALMAGKPVVASDVGGIPWLVGGAGMLVPYGDAEGLRSALRKVLGEPGVARTLAEAAARRGRELPDGDDAVESVLGVYKGARSNG